jgi:hypothetical protein
MTIAYFLCMFIRCELVEFLAKLFSSLKTRQPTLKPFLKRYQPDGRFSIDHPLMATTICDDSKISSFLSALLLEREHCSGQPCQARCQKTTSAVCNGCKCAKEKGIKTSTLQSQSRPEFVASSLASGKADLASCCDGT